MQYVAFVSDHFHQEEMHLRRVHSVVYIGSLFLLLLKNIPLDLSTTVPLFTRQLSFQLLTMLSKAATNIYV